MHGFFAALSLICQEISVRSEMEPMKAHVHPVRKRYKSTLAERRVKEFGAIQNPKLNGYFKSRTGFSWSESLMPVTEPSFKLH
jgi:hypothetical protein